MAQASQLWYRYRYKCKFGVQEATAHVDNKVRVNGTAKRGTGGEPAAFPRRFWGAAAPTLAGYIVLWGWDLNARVVPMHQGPISSFFQPETTGRRAPRYQRRPSLQSSARFDLIRMILTWALEHETK